MNLLTNAREAMPKGGQVRLEKLSSTTLCSIARWRTSPSRATRQEMRAFVCEAARILAESIDYARRGQLTLRDGRPR